MKQTKKEIKALKEKREKDRQWYIYGYRDTDEYKELNIKLLELNKQISSVKTKWEQTHKMDLNTCNNDLKYYEELLKQKYLDVNDYNENVKKSFSLYHNGSTWGYHKEVIWVSEDEKYALFTIPSHTEYVDRFTGSSSSPSEWLLVNTELFHQSHRGGIHSINSKGVIYKQDRGRWSSKFEKLILEKIEEYEKNININ